VVIWRLLESLSYNINRKNSDLKLFEFGNTYHKYDSGYVENKHLSIALTGSRSKAHWSKNTGSTDVFYLKGVIRSLLEGLGLKNLTYGKIKNDIFSEGVSLNLGKAKIVEFGVLKTSLLKEFGIKQEVLFADFDWDKVIENAGKTGIKISELPKYPEVRRDLALLLDENIEFIDLYNFAFQSERKLLKDVDLFDVYMGDKLPEGKKSYAMSFILQDDKKTLTDKQIDKIMNKLQEGFKNNFKAELR
jgi:phenylalanyl-tRNA synthetase beta chain